MKPVTMVKMAVWGWRICLAGIMFLLACVWWASWFVSEPAQTEVIKIFVGSMVAFSVGFIANVMVVRGYLKTVDAAEADTDRAAKVRALRP